MSIYLFSGAEKGNPLEALMSQVLSTATWTLRGALAPAPAPRAWPTCAERMTLSKDNYGESKWDIRHRSNNIFF